MIMADIIGTELDDPNLVGTAGADTISGLGGRDHLYGGAGNDTLLGGAGDDAMHGDAGADNMFGGSGNDDYYVDDVNDVVSETTTPGVDDGGTNDRVYSTVSYTLSPFLERLVLLESAVAFNATGNAQVNSIVGNSNANIISGGGGKDTLTGGLAADPFVPGPANVANTVPITDFAAEDKFGITASDYGLSQGSGLVDNGSGALVLDPNWFATVTGTQGTVAGHGQFLYNTTTRSVMWDSDGSGALAGIARATLQTGAVVSAGNFAISGTTGSSPAVGNISITDVTITEGNSGTKVATFTVSHTGGAAFSVNYATANSTATAGSDYVAASGTLNFAAGTLTQTVSMTINGDTIYEPNETFFVNLTGATGGGLIIKNAGLGTIANDDTVPVGPAVVAVHDMSAVASGIGSWDPSGLTYDPATGTLYLVDSEVDEVTPRGAANMWALNLDGTLKPNGAISLYGYTTEPTGIAFDPTTGKMYITDDDTFNIYVTNVANPSAKLSQFATKPLGGDDPEEVAFNPVNGHLYIANGSDIAHPEIIEIDSIGTQVIRNIPLPAVIKDPEAVVYDAAHDVFFVGIENGHEIWMVDHNGNILNDINIFANYRNPVNNGSVNLKGLTLAPSSDPNDDPSVLSLYAADFGVSHVNDGRLFEISNPFYFNHAAPVISTNNVATVQNPDGSMTVLGLQVTDSDALASSQTFSLTETTGAAASGSSVTPPTSTGSLTNINSILATGVTYHPGLTPSSNDMVTLTVKDNFGALDTVNLVFDPSGSVPNVTLQGTSGKDVIFATNSQDVLAGLAAKDQFVFA